MRCLFVFRNAQGWLPSAGDLRRLGFRISEAVAPAEPVALPAVEPPLALAAETAGCYGGLRPEECNERP